MSPNERKRPWSGSSRKKLVLTARVTPPVYLSGNSEGGRARNIVLKNDYLPRVKHL